MSDDADEPIEDLGENAAAGLEGFIERIEKLEGEKKVAGEKVKAEYAAALAAGFDKAAMRQVVKDRRADMEKTIELRAIVATYRRALARRVGNALGDLGRWARDWRQKEQTVGLSQDDIEARADYARPLDEMLKGRQTKGSKRNDAPDDGDGAQPS